MSDLPNGLTYAQAGVDIDAGNALVDAIKPLAKATRRPGAEASLGGFGALRGRISQLLEQLLKRRLEGLRDPRSWIRRLTRHALAQPGAGGSRRSGWSDVPTGTSEE